MVHGHVAPNIMTLACAARGGHLGTATWVLALLEGTLDSDAELLETVQLQKDALGSSMLPLQCDWRPAAFAAEGSHLAIVRWLRKRDFVIWRPAWELAAGRGHRHVIEWLVQEAEDDLVRRAALSPRDGPRQRSMGAYGPAACEAAARRGDLDLLGWLVLDLGLEWNAGVCLAAARQGHLDILRWADAHGANWDAQVAEAAAQGGHLAVLQWLRHRDCPWDNCTTDAALRHGHFDVLRWAIGNGCPHEWSKLAVHVGRGGSIQDIEWLFSLHDVAWSSVIANAARVGRADIVTWVLALGGERAASRRVDDLAATGGHVCVLEALEIAGASACNHWTMQRAIEGGHVGTIAWLHAGGCPWGTRACASAALHGHLGALKWLRAHGCTWDEQVCHLAAQQGHLHVLKWAYENGAPCDVSTFAAASRSGDMPTLLWVLNHDCPKKIEDLLALSVQSPFGRTVRIVTDGQTLKAVVGVYKGWELDLCAAVAQLRQPTTAQCRVESSERDELDGNP